MTTATVQPTPATAEPKYSHATGEPIDPADFLEAPLSKIWACTWRNDGPIPFSGYVKPCGKDAHMPPVDTVSRNHHEGVCPKHLAILVEGNGTPPKAPTTPAALEPWQLYLPGDFKPVAKLYDMVYESEASAKAHAGGWRCTYDGTTCGRDHSISTCANHPTHIFPSNLDGTGGLCAEHFKLLPLPAGTPHGFGPKSKAPAKPTQPIAEGTPYYKDCDLKVYVAKPWFEPTANGAEWVCTYRGDGGMRYDDSPTSTGCGKPGRKPTGETISDHQKLESAGLCDQHYAMALDTSTTTPTPADPNAFQHGGVTWCHSGDSDQNNTCTANYSNCTSSPVVAHSKARSRWRCANCAEHDGMPVKTAPPLRSQKARGLRHASFSLKGGHLRSDAIRQATIWPHQPDPRVAYPMFARPCPTRPRHGFVDSRIVKDAKDFLALQKQTLAADPDGEIICMPFITPAWSAILTEAGLTMGPENDGATSGHGSRSIPAPSPNLLSMLGLNAKACDVATSPYIEVVAPKAGTMATNWPQLVQVRDGPKPSLLDRYVPEAVKVCEIVEAKGDLLEWETRAKSFKPCTVVWHPGGTLASHYAVHCVINKVPILCTPDPPTMDSTLEPCLAAPPLAEADYATIAAATQLANATTLTEKTWSNLCRISTATLHAQSVWGPERHLLLLRGMALGTLTHLAQAAVLGELRHFMNRGPGRCGFDPLTPVPQGGERSSVYIASFSMDPAKRATWVKSAHYDYALKDWGGSYGGAKWASCSESARLLVQAASDFVANPTEAKWAKAIERMNRVINEAHNGGAFLNKYMDTEAFNALSTNPALGFLNDQAAALVLTPPGSLPAPDATLHRAIRDAATRHDSDPSNTDRPTPPKCKDCGKYSKLCGGDCSGSDDEDDETETCPECDHTTDDCQCCSECEHHPCTCEADEPEAEATPGDKPEAPQASLKMVPTVNKAKDYVWDTKAGNKCMVENVRSKANPTQFAHSGATYGSVNCQKNRHWRNPQSGSGASLCNQHFIDLCLANKKPIPQKALALWKKHGGTTPKAPEPEPEATKTYKAATAQLVEALSTTLPDGVWPAQVKVESGEVHIQVMCPKVNRKYGASVNVAKPSALEAASGLKADTPSLNGGNSNTYAKGTLSIMGATRAWAYAGDSTKSFSWTSDQEAMQ